MMSRCPRLNRRFGRRPFLRGLADGLEELALGLRVGRMRLQGERETELSLRNSARIFSARSP